MAPVIALGPGPARQPLAQERAIDRRRELLHPAKERVRPDHQRRGLDEPGGRVGGHLVGQREDGPGAHQAVGVEHEHRVMRPAPCLDPVADIAGLAPGIVAATAIPDPHAGRQHRAQRRMGAPLGPRDARVLRVAEDVEIEAVRGRRGAQRLHHGAGIAEHVRGILVIDRHHERHAQRRRGAGRAARAQPAAGEAERRGGQRECDPEEGDRHQRKKPPFEPPHAPIGQPVAKGPGEPAGGRDRGQERRRAPRPDAPVGMPCRCGRIVPGARQVLHRVRERVRRRHRVAAGKRAHAVHR